jgi:uncharacterized repeat protein (TIGR01451 family)
MFFQLRRRNVNRLQEGKRQRRLFFESLEDRRVMAAFTWSAAAAGNWSSAANWSVVGVDADNIPDADDTVTFSNTSVQNSTIDFGGAFAGTIQSLTVNSTYTGVIVLGNQANVVNTLTVTSDATIAGKLRFDHGTGANTGDVLDVGGNLVLDQGAILANDTNTGLTGLPVIPTGDSATPITVLVDGFMQMKAGSEIRAENNNSGGNGGNISISVTGAFTMDGPSGALAGALISSSKTAGAGDTGSAGNISIDVGGDVNLKVGSVIKADGTGPAGNISLSVGGNFTMHGTAVPLAGAVISSVGGSVGNGGNITITVTGDVLTETGTKILSDGRSGGAIAISAENIDIDGLVSSHGTITGVANQPPGGGTITVIATDELTISDTGVVSSSGLDPGADLVHLEGCHVTIYGLVESTGAGHALPTNPSNHLNTHANHPAGSTAGVEIWADELLLIDSTGTHKGQVNADLTAGASRRSWIDLFARGDIQIVGQAAATGTFFAVHATNAGNVPTGGQITIISTEGTVTASGLAVNAGAQTAGLVNPPDGNAAGGKGGLISIAANGNITLNTATLMARGDDVPTVGTGGTINVRSATGAISWTGGVGDVRPTGQDLVPPISGDLPAAQRGVITLQAALLVTTTGTTFPFLPPNTNTAPTTPTIQANSSSAAPTLFEYVTLPECEEDLGSIAWEKRADAAPFSLLVGATFTITPDPTTGSGSLTVADNGPNDANPADGQFLVINVPVGTYTVTETIPPAGYALDDDVTRSVAVTAAALNAVIGIQDQDDPGNSEGSDFHDPLGSITWEKRDTAGALLTVAGATFTVSPNPQVGGSGTFTVIDNSTNDADPTVGVIKVADVKVGTTYTITEITPPPGYALDPSPTRTITVPSSGTLDVTIGTTGNDTSDFHDPLGSITWEKRDTAGALITVAGATFTVSPNPQVGGSGTFTVIDNGTHDADSTIGVIKVANVKVGTTYTITETIPPPGYALDLSPSRTVTVPSSGTLDVNVGTSGEDDESDFHDDPASIHIEKTGTSLSKIGDPVTYTYVVTNTTEGSAPLDNVVVTDDNATPGNTADDFHPAFVGGDGNNNGFLDFGEQWTFSATITVPATASDPMVNVATVTANPVEDQTVVSSTDSFSVNLFQPAISIEKSGSPLTVQVGDTVTYQYTVRNAGSADSPALENVVLTDDRGTPGNTADDFHPTFVGGDTIANGQLDLGEVWTYTATVTVPANATTPLVNEVVVTAKVVGFPNTLRASDDFSVNVLGSIAWEKRNDAAPFALLPGATFTITPNPQTGSGVLTVVDNGPFDANSTLGQFLVKGVPAGTYTVTETIPPTGFGLDNDPTRTVTVASGDLSAVIGNQGVDDPGDGEESDFHDREQVIVITPDKCNSAPPVVQIVNLVTGELLSRFLAYEPSYRGGVRVATGDLNGDGVDEIITAPGRNHSPLVKVFDQSGNLLYSFLAYANTFKGGVNVAVGEVVRDMDGVVRNEIITAMSYNGNQVKVFKNTSSGPVPFTPLSFTTFSSFNPFGTSFKGGAVVAAADLGTPKTVGTVKSLDSSALDGRAEVIVGNGSGMRSTVKVFTYFGSSSTATLVRTFLPFSATFRGGISLDVANVNDDGPVGPAGDIPDIIVAAGNGGSSQVQVLNGINGNILSGFTAYAPPDAPSTNAPVHVAALDEDGDGTADFILTAQGTDGATRIIRKFDALTGDLVDQFMESSADFCGAYFLETILHRAGQALAS